MLYNHMLFFFFFSAVGALFMRDILQVIGVVFLSTEAGPLYLHIIHYYTVYPK